MADRDKIEGLVRHLRQSLTYLHELASLPEPQFLADPHAIGSARYYLTISIEACLDIAGHLIASEGMRAPHNYKDTFSVLNEAGILPDEIAATMRSLAGLRNLLVHIYWNVDDTMIYDSLKSELDDFEAFVAHIMGYLDSSEKPTMAPTN